MIRAATTASETRSDRGLYYKSFRGSVGVPWTGLGYTYDWGNPDSDVNASEFILVPAAPYTIEAVVPTMAYCRP